MKMTEPSDKYGQQPAHNESFMPPAPQSYYEAVGASEANKSLYPDPPSFPVESISQPAVPQPVVTPPISITVAVGPNPSLITCPHCNIRMTTVTKSVPSRSAHLACFLLCLCGCCPCSCIPYCMKSFSDIHHSCPVCKSYIGVYKN